MTAQDKFIAEHFPKFLVYFHLPTVLVFFFGFYFIRGFVGRSVIDHRLNHQFPTDVVPMPLIILLWEFFAFLGVLALAVFALLKMVKIMSLIPETLGDWTKEFGGDVVRLFRKQYLKWKYRPHKDKPLDINDGPFRSAKAKIYALEHPGDHPHIYQATRVPDTCDFCGHHKDEHRDRAA